MHYYAMKDWSPNELKVDRDDFDLILRGGMQVAGCRDRVTWGDVVAWRPYYDGIDTSIPRVRLRAERGGE